MSLITSIGTRGDRANDVFFVDVRFEVRSITEFAYIARPVIHSAC